MITGCPLKFKTAKELEDKIEAYFADCRENERPYTISGLALALKVDRKTIVNYSHKEEFFPTIKEARAKCENYAEEQLFTGKNTAGVIFNLKNNYSWKDQQDVNLGGQEDNPIEVSVKHKLLSKLTEEELEALIDD